MIRDVRKLDIYYKIFKKTESVCYRDGIATQETPPLMFLIPIHLISKFLYDHVVQIAVSSALPLATN